MRYLNQFQQINPKCNHLFLFEQSNSCPFNCRRSIQLTLVNSNYPMHPFRQIDVIISIIGRVCQTNFAIPITDANFTRAIS